MTIFDQQAAESRPYGSAIAIDISSTDHALDNASRGFFVGVTGNVKVDLEGFEDGKSATGITLIAVPAGFSPIRVKKVYKSGTTATDMYAMY